jgi:hypothetical protein
MKFLEFFIMALLFTFLFIGIYFLWLNLPIETLDFEQYQVNFTKGLSKNSTQFYPNMRYEDNTIRYTFSGNCSSKKEKDFKEATYALEEKTTLNFEESNLPHLVVSCSNVSPQPEEAGHFVAGEGGPTTIINASKFSVILTGKIALYRPELCDTPQVAIHEILHALGFDHNNNNASIMYPFTDCHQTIDREIIGEINRLYSTPSMPDLAIEFINANKTGRFLNFNIAIVNTGLKKVENSTLKITVENLVIKNYVLGDMEIGSTRFLNVENLKFPKDTKKVSFLVETIQEEIDKNNNFAEIEIVNLR